MPRSQSALEFLMTYGWSILIICVVVAILYGLGAFGNITNSESFCRALPGFQCSSGTLNTAGALSFTFGFTGGFSNTKPLVLSAIGCSNGTAVPTSWSASAVNVSPLSPQQSETVTAPCKLKGKSGIGAPLTGTIWVQYYSNGATQAAEVGTMSYSATSSASYHTTPIATISLGGWGPEEIAYDPNDGYMYVSEHLLPAVRVISGINPIAAITVGQNPYGLAYNPTNGYMYVANSGASSFSVNVISGTATVGPSIPFSSGPQWMAYNPANGYMYVVNQGYGVGNVISGTTPITSIPVGLLPVEIAYDPSDGYMYVTNLGDSTATVISGTTAIATIPVGAWPQGIAYNPGNGDMYIVDTNSQSVNVISGTNPVASITVAPNPEEIAYDPSNGYMYVTEETSGTVNVISGTTPIFSIPVGSEPMGIAYNPTNGNMYVVNYLGGSVSVI